MEKAPSSILIIIISIIIGSYSPWMHNPYAENFGLVFMEFEKSTSG